MSEPLTSPRFQSSLIHGDEEEAAIQDAVRRRIVAAAKHKFARFGYEGTQYADIAHSADVSPAELSLYFDQKLDILMAVFDDGWTNINQRLEDILIVKLSARDMAMSMLALMVNILERDEDLARLLLFEGRRPHPETGQIRLSEGFRKFERLCAEVAARGQKDGSFSAAHDPRVMACVLTGAAEALMRMQIIGEQNHGMAPFTGRELQAIFEALLGSMRPRERLLMS